VDNLFKCLRCNTLGLYRITLYEICSYGFIIIVGCWLWQITTA